GMPVIFRTVFKPTASIAKPQETLNRKTGKTEVLEVTGRHDPCIAVRAVPVMNAVSALVVADLLTQRYGNLWLGETK
ncbi:MAG: chorismate synthase, partial [Erysipelotrichales bacterium]|nr:chorismate synthase [Erysipelotrichales bacterium]